MPTHTQPDPDRPAVTVDEACSILKVSRPTIYAMVRRGDLSLFKIGRSSRLNRRQVLALIGESAPSEGGDAA